MNYVKVNVSRLVGVENLFRTPNLVSKKRDLCSAASSTMSNSNRLILRRNLLSMNSEEIKRGNNTMEKKKSFSYIKYNTKIQKK